LIIWFLQQNSSTFNGSASSDRVIANCRDTPKNLFENFDNALPLCKDRVNSRFEYGWAVHDPQESNNLSSNIRNSCVQKDKRWIKLKIRFQKTNLPRKLTQEPDQLFCE
jgi:hypothetical protein